MTLKTQVSIEPSALPGLSLADILSGAELQNLATRLERSAELHVILRIARQDNARSRRMLGN